MSVRITDEVMISDLTKHAAAQVPGVGWVVSWLPGRPLDQDQAITAMMLAEAVAKMQTEGRTRVVDHTHPLWRRIDAWAAELGLTGPGAVARVSETPAGDQPATTDPADPGPAPEQVEPETVGNVTTIPVSTRSLVRVTTDVGRTGRTGLTVETAAGESVTVALPVGLVDALCEALAAAAPVLYVPDLPEVKVFTAVPPPVGGEVR